MFVPSRLLEAVLWILPNKPERAKTRFMKHAASPYNGQFSIMPDPMHLAIPRMEIVAEMALRGEHEALNDACLAVAIVADVVSCASAKAHTPGPKKS